jgi:uncharacterized protein YuzE
MKITYDKVADAMYLKLEEERTYKSSKKISDEVVADYSNDGRVLGVEILAASENIGLPLPKSSIPVEFSSLR